MLLLNTACVRLLICISRVVLKLRFDAYKNPLQHNPMFASVRLRHRSTKVPLFLFSIYCFCYLVHNIQLIAAE
jgi:hypothetical protein